MTKKELEQKIREIDEQINDLYLQRFWLVIELHKAEMAEARRNDDDEKGEEASKYDSEI